jgi:hypothetical protein
LFAFMYINFGCCLFVFANIGAIFSKELLFIVFFF